MPRVTRAFAAAFALFSPIGCTLLVLLTPVAEIGAGLLLTQAAYAQNATDLLDSGNAKVQRRDWQGAIADFTKIIELHPQDANAVVAYNNRGNIRMELKDYQEAMSDFRKAVAFNPDYALTYYNRGNLKLELKDYQGAIDDYSKAIDLNPEMYRAYTNRGNAFQRAGNLKSACQNWKKAAELGSAREIYWFTNYC